MPIRNPKALGEAIRNARRQQHLQQGELAAAAGVARRVVINAEAGRSITTENLFRLLQALSLELDVSRTGSRLVLFGGDDNE